MASIKSVISNMGMQEYIILAAFISIVTPILSIGTFQIFTKYQHDTSFDKNKVTINRYADLLQAGMRLPLWNVSANLAEPLIDSVAIDKSVSSITVLNASDKVFTEYITDKVDDENQIITSRPVTYQKDYIGEIIVSYSLENAKKEALEEARFLFSLLVCQLFISLGILFWYLRFRIVNPIQKLEKAAKEIADGEFNTPFPDKNLGELNDIAKNLEAMRQQTLGAMERLKKLEQDEFQPKAPKL